MGLANIRIARQLVRLARELVAFKTGKVMLQVATELSGHTVTDIVKFSTEDKDTFGKVKECIDAIANTINLNKSFFGRDDNDFVEWMWKRLETEYSKFVKNGQPIDSEFEEVHDAWALYLGFLKKDQVKKEATSLRNEVKSGRESTDGFVEKVKAMEDKIRELCPNYKTEDDVKASWKFFNDNRKIFSMGGYDCYKVEDGDYDMLSDVATEPATEWCVAQKGNSGIVHFNDYKAPYYMVALSDKPVALIHIDTRQFKDAKDEKYINDSNGIDDTVYKIAKRLFFENGFCECNIDTVKNEAKKRKLRIDDRTAMAVVSQIWRKHGGGDIPWVDGISEKGIGTFVEFFISKDDRVEMLKRLSRREDLEAAIDFLGDENRNGYVEPNDGISTKEYNVIYSKGKTGWKAIAKCVRKLFRDDFLEMFEKGDDELRSLLARYHANEMTSYEIGWLADNGKIKDLCTVAENLNYYGDHNGVFASLIDLNDQRVDNALCNSVGIFWGISNYDTDVVEKFLRRIDIAVFARLTEGFLMQYCSAFYRPRHSSEVLEKVLEVCAERNVDMTKVKKKLSELKYDDMVRLIQERVG